MEAGYPLAAVSNIQILTVTTLKKVIQFKQKFKGCGKFPPGACPRLAIVPRGTGLSQMFQSFEANCGVIQLRNECNIFLVCEVRQELEGTFVI